MSQSLMSTTFIPNLKKIHQYLVPQSSKKTSETTHTQTFNYSFWVFGSSRQLTIMTMVSLTSHWIAESNRPQF